MKIGQLRALLLELAAQSEASGDCGHAKALQKLAEAFDGPGHHTVTTKLAQIRVARCL